MKTEENTNNYEIAGQETARLLDLIFMGADELPREEVIERIEILLDNPEIVDTLFEFVVTSLESISESVSESVSDSDEFIEESIEESIDNIVEESIDNKKSEISQDCNDDNFIDIEEIFYHPEALLLGYKIDKI